MQEVEVNGSIIEFPDNMSNEQIASVLKKQKIEKPKEQDFFDKYGEEYIRPSMQAAGATLGTLIGSPIPVVGSAIAGGVGYAGGEQAYRTLKQLLGKEKQESIPEEVLNVFKNVATGTGLEIAGAGLGSALKGVVKAVAPATKSVASVIYKVPKEAISRIVERPEQVKKLVGQSTFDLGEKLLQEVTEKDRGYVNALNKELDSVINTAQKGNELVDVRSVVNTLRKRAYSIKAMTEEAVSQKAELLSRADVLDDYLDKTAAKRIKQYVGEAPLNSTEIESLKKSIKYRVSPNEAQTLKRQLQDAASEKTQVGLSFKRKDAAGKALTKASTKAKEAVEKAVPEVKGINKKLQEHIQLKESSAIKTAFKPENIERTVKTVQSQKSNKGFLQKQIKKLDKTIGTNIEDITKDINAAQYLESEQGGIAKYLPSSVMGAATPAGLGYMAGGIPGAVAGGAISSPAVFRNVAPNLKHVLKALNLTEEELATPRGQAALKALVYSLGGEKK